MSREVLVEALKEAEDVAFKWNQWIACESMRLRDAQTPWEALAAAKDLSASRATAASSAAVVAEIRAALAALEVG